MSEIYKINISLLKNYEQQFNNEKENFKNSTYKAFTSSYLKKCSDYNIIKMADNLEKIYSKLDNAYNNIDKWWLSYNENIEGLENSLSNDNKSGVITESSVKNYVNGQLPVLTNYRLKFAGIITTPTIGTVSSNLFVNNTATVFNDPFSSLYSGYDVNSINVEKTINSEVSNQQEESIVNVKEEIKDIISDTTANIKNIISDTTANIKDIFANVNSKLSNGSECLWANFTNWKDDMKYWVNKEVIPWVGESFERVTNVLYSVGATIAAFDFSLIEGLLQFGEAIIDFSLLATAVMTSKYTIVLDVQQAIYGAITGNDWTSLTNFMWEETKSFVSNKYVSSWFNSLYQNTNFGRKIAENAYVFETTRAVGSGIGYVAGVVALTICTFGAGSAVAAGGSVGAATAASATTASQMAITATAAGIGKGTQNAWADGANLGEGLAAGTLSGLWDGLQFYIGAKIGRTNLFGPEGIIKSIGGSGIGIKILNSLGRIVLDGVDGGVEGFVQPIINLIYKDGYYDENGNYLEFSQDKNVFERYSEIFDDNGGWSFVWTQAAIGSATSLLGEAFDLAKYFEQEISKVDSTNSNNLKNTESYSTNLNLEQQVTLANYRTKKGMFYTIKVNSLDEIPADFWSKINDPSNVYIAVGEKIISFEEYKSILNGNNNTISFKNNIEICQFFNDSTQYVVNLIDSIYNRNINNVDVKNEILKIANIINNTPVRELESLNIIENLKKYLSKQELETLNNIINSSLQDVQYTSLDKDLIMSYTAHAGPAICAFLRKTQCVFDNVVFDGKNISQINDYVCRSNYAVGKGKELMNYMNAENFVKALDEIIHKSNPLKENLIVYRGVESLYLDGNKICTFEIGQRFNDSAFVSTSVVPSRISSRNNVKLEIELPKGTKAAYLEKYSGVTNYNQQELLIERNSTFEIIDYPIIDPDTGQITIKAKLIL